MSAGAPRDACSRETARGERRAGWQACRRDSVGRHATLGDAEARRRRHVVQRSKWPSGSLHWRGAGVVAFVFGRAAHPVRISSDPLLFPPPPPAFSFRFDDSSASSLHTSHRRVCSLRASLLQCRGVPAPPTDGLHRALVIDDGGDPEQQLAGMPLPEPGAGGTTAS
nr:unnamed protein product [Digitaria exilis]